MGPDAPVTVPDGLSALGRVLGRVRHRNAPDGPVRVTGPDGKVTLMDTTTDPLLTSTEVAARIGVTRSTLTAYKTRRQMPAPDVQYGRTPLWKASTIDNWRPRHQPDPVD